MNKTALVTGSSGFVGRHLVKRLEQDGWQVTPMDIKNDIHYSYHDLLVELKVHPVWSYDAVFHLAANIEDINQRMHSNHSAYKDIELDLCVADFCRRTSPQVLVWPTSCAVDNPEDPYAWVKLTGEKIFGALAKSGQRVVMLRPFSGYGVDQALSYPFPAILQRALNKENPLTVWGHGQQVRDWIHVDDLVNAFMVGLENFPSGVPIDIGTGIGTSVTSLARMIADAVGYKPNIKALSDKATSSNRRVADISEATSYGFSAQVHLWDGIRAAVKAKQEQQLEV